MTPYFNEFDVFPAEWLRRLFPAALIDDRSITNVQPADLAGHSRTHFFAGVGGWEYALSLAGWPEGRPVWTGSCPCQPFSAAGKRGGGADARHLWPEFHRLIAECRPATVFGEQVAGADGRAWLSAVRADLEALGYAVGAADLCAAGVGAPHIRQRLYWVANATGAGRCWRATLAGNEGGPAGGPGAHLRNESWPDGRGRGSTLGVADVLSPSHGVPGRVGQLRAYGNAIVPQVAAEFIAAFMEAEVPA